MTTDVGTLNPMTPLEGRLSTLNITGSVVIKATPGRVFKVSVIVAGGAAGTINDCATTGAAAATNQIGTAPTTVGTVDFNWPMATGIVVVPGSGQTLAITWE
jgi:hypothetical protein